MTCAKYIVGLDVNSNQYLWTAYATSKSWGTGRGKTRILHTIDENSCRSRCPLSGSDSVEGFIKRLTVNKCVQAMQFLIESIPVWMCIYQHFSEYNHTQVGSRPIINVIKNIYIIKVLVVLSLLPPSPSLLRSLSLSCITNREETEQAHWLQPVMHSRTKESELVV